MTEQKLYAFLGETLVGEFTRNANGTIAFRYFGDYRWSDNPTPISLSMPLAQETHTGTVASNFLDALVPESQQARKESQRIHHASTTDAFDLLQAIGFDATGALRLSSSPDLPVENQYLLPIDDSTIAARLRAAAPTGIQPAGVKEHWSVAGQQGKIALRLHDDRWYTAEGTARTTHILKPGIPTLPNQAFDEHLTMRIAAHMGLRVANTTFRLFEGVPAIIIERYDRITDDKGDVTALHQEDLTQAMGIPSSLKYEEHNGPTSERYAAMIRCHGLNGEGEANVRAFVDGILVSYLLGATDSHAKNYSLLIKGDSVRMAPLYDLASIYPYLGHGSIGASTTLAMNIGGRRNLLQLRRKHLERFASRMGLPAEDVLHRFATLTRRMPDAFEQAITEQQVTDDSYASTVGATLIDDYRKRLLMTHDDAMHWLTESTL